MGDATDAPIVLQKMEVIDLPSVTALEEESYPADEAASRKVLDYRINYARDLCYVAFLQQQAQRLVGFVVATGAPDDTVRMTEDMMQNHYQGNVLCIHSVVVDPKYRRKGYGLSMMKAYLDKIKEHTTMKRALLLTKRHHISFYEKVGFREIGPSSISHGKDQWIEMQIDF